MALIKVDLTGAIEAGQLILSHVTAKDWQQYPQTMGIAASNVANYLCQAVLHDQTGPGPVLAAASPEHALASEVLDSAKKAMHEPIGSVLSETWKTFFANLTKWLLSLGIKI